MNIDPAAVEAAITPRTKAIVPVHFAGRPVDMDALREIADKHNLLVIEDAAHAIETVYHGKRVGSHRRYQLLQLLRTKNMTTGEGGMVTTNDAEARGESSGLRPPRHVGRRVDSLLRQGFKHYDVVCAGFKYNLTDLAASLGLVQLPQARGLARAARGAVGPVRRRVR